MVKPAHSDAYLEEIREVDEHVVPRLLLSASNIEADGDDVHALATLCELVLNGKRVQACSGERDDFRQAEGSGNLLNLPASWWARAA